MAAGAEGEEGLTQKKGQRMLSDGLGRGRLETKERSEMQEGRGMETDGAVGQGEAANGNVVDGGLKPRREDPKLIRTSVKIAYTSSDGYRAEMKCPGGKGTKHRVTGEEVPPEAALLSGLRELARLTALYGFEKKALEEFTKAQADVAEWKANR